MVLWLLSVSEDFQLPRSRNRLRLMLWLAPAGLHVTVEEASVPSWPGYPDSGGMSCSQSWWMSWAGSYHASHIDEHLKVQRPPQPYGSVDLAVIRDKYKLDSTSKRPPKGYYSTLVHSPRQYKIARHSFLFDVVFGYLVNRSGSNMTYAHLHRFFFYWDRQKEYFSTTTLLKP